MILAVEEHVIGVDFGTDSVRAAVVGARSGEAVAHAVAGYRRWGEGLYCDPRANRFRQHPLDHIEGLEAAVNEALAACPRGTAQSVRGISVDTTGSTPGPVDREGVPLAMRPEFADDPDAMFILWKDHTAVGEAGEITRAAREWGGTDYTMYEGGFYSAEWFFSKMLHVLRTNEQVRGAAFSWVEHCDWLPALLTRNADALAIKRSRCAAGHKAMWHKAFGGLPSEEFLAGIDPVLAGVRERLYAQTVTADQPAGTLSREWASRLGLDRHVVVGTGAIDAHMGAVGAGIEPYVLTKVIGTSTSDMLVAPTEDLEGKLIKGICGQVDGSIIPGMLGMEAGQSAFGDVFAWFRDLLGWGSDGAADADLMQRLMDAASGLENGPASAVSLDWINGRRTPDADQTLKGAITGISLGTDAPEIFKSLIDATAFGARSIVERFAAEGVPIKEVIALGGIPRKAPLVMQTLADVLGLAVRVSASEQACALGAAMFAAIACGIHRNVTEAQDAMSCGFDAVYQPRREIAARYEAKYEEYRRLGEAVEGLNRGARKTD